ncbi:hypothetical protein C1I97_04465 [Streptomyces sp. NTH33]|nr:hypothetical protein C1I97_04465 [Streptomyces sp. NTH33]
MGEPAGAAPRDAGPREEHGERPPRLPVAMLSALAGVLCLRHPLQTVAALSLIVGVAFAWWSALRKARTGVLPGPAATV